MKLGWYAFVPTSQIDSGTSVALEDMQNMMWVPDSTADTVSVIGMKGWSSHNAVANKLYTFENSYVTPTAITSHAAAPTASIAGSAGAVSKVGEYAVWTIAVTTSIGIPKNGAMLVEFLEANIDMQTEGFHCTLLDSASKYITSTCVLDVGNKYWAGAGFNGCLDGTGAEVACNNRWVGRLDVTADPGNNVSVRVRTFAEVPTLFSTLPNSSRDRTIEDFTLNIDVTGLINTAAPAAFNTPEELSILLPRENDYRLVRSQENAPFSFTFLPSAVLAKGEAVTPGYVEITDTGPSFATRPTSGKTPTCRAIFNNITDGTRHAASKCEFAAGTTISAWAPLTYELPHSKVYTVSIYTTNNDNAATEDGILYPDFGTDPTSALLIAQKPDAAPPAAFTWVYKTLPLIATNKLQATARAVNTLQSVTDNIFEISILGLWNAYNDADHEARISIEFDTGPDGYNTDLADGSTNLDEKDFKCQCETVTGSAVASHDQTPIPFKDPHTDTLCFLEQGAFSGTDQIAHMPLDTRITITQQDEEITGTDYYRIYIPNVTNNTVGKDTWIRVYIWTITTADDTEKLVQMVQIPWVFETRDDTVDTSETAQPWLAYKDRSLIQPYTTDGELSHGDRQVNNSFGSNPEVDVIEVRTKLAAVDLVDSDYILWEWDQAIVSDTVKITDGDAGDTTFATVLARFNDDKKLLVKLVAICTQNTDCDWHFRNWINPAGVDTSISNTDVKIHMMPGGIYNKRVDLSNYQELCLVVGVAGNPAGCVDECTSAGQPPGCVDNVIEAERYGATGLTDMEVWKGWTGFPRLLETDPANPGTTPIN